MRTTTLALTGLLCSAALADANPLLRLLLGVAEESAAAETAVAVEARTASALAAEARAASNVERAAYAGAKRGASGSSVGGDLASLATNLATSGGAPAAEPRRVISADGQPTYREPERAYRPAPAYQERPPQYVEREPVMVRRTIYLGSSPIMRYDPRRGCCVRVGTRHHYRDVWEPAR